MEGLKGYIKKKSPVPVEEIKEFLMKMYKASTWEECVDKQVFGTCNKIVHKIYDHFPGVFNTIYDIHVDYSDIAQKKLNDNEDMFGNHYVLGRGKTLYDFAKGANTINGVYLLTQYDDMHDKYKITLSGKEKSLINDKYRRAFN